MCHACRAGEGVCFICFDLQYFVQEMRGIFSKSFGGPEKGRLVFCVGVQISDTSGYLQYGHFLLTISCE